MSDLRDRNEEEKMEEVLKFLGIADIQVKIETTRLLKVLETVGIDANLISVIVLIRLACIYSKVLSGMPVPETFVLELVKSELKAARIAITRDTELFNDLEKKSMRFLDFLESAKVIDEGTRRAMDADVLRSLTGEKDEPA